MVTKEIVKINEPKYEFIYIRLIQVAVKPLVQRDPDTAINITVSHGWPTNGRVLGTEKISLNEGPIYCNYKTNLIIKLKDKNVLKVIELDVKLHGFKMLPGTFPAAIIYKIYSKTMNTLYHTGEINRRTKGKIIYFQTASNKENVHIPGTLIWDQVTLANDWLLKKAIPATGVWHSWL